jgi:hypothetical protein
VFLVKKILLSDLIPVETQVELAPGKFLPVRPLSLVEITTLLLQYRESLVDLYNEAQKLEPSYPVVLAAVPEMVADIICMGADIIEQRDTVVKLPPGTQLQLIAAIWELSVPDAKKLVESLSKLMAQVQRLASAKNPVPTPPTIPEGPSPTLSGSTST